MDLGLEGRNFVIVGGTYGMGWGAATCLAADGANVALLARDADRAAAKAAELTAEFGVRAVGIPADGAKRDGNLQAAIDRAAEELGPLRGLAVTAGPMNKQGRFLEHEDDSWDWYYEAILMMTVRANRAVIPHLQRNGGGTIVNTSAYSIRGTKKRIAPYTAMKAALATMSKVLAKTYAEDGIRVNVFCPGMFDTNIDGGRERQAKELGVPVEEALYTMLSTNPEWAMPVALARAGLPHEAGEMIAFMLSDRAAYMTGAWVNVDGGTDF